MSAIAGTELDKQPPGVGVGMLVISLRTVCDICRLENADCRPPAVSFHCRLLAVSLHSSLLTVSCSLAVWGNTILLCKRLKKQS